MCDFCEVEHFSVLKRGRCTTFGGNTVCGKMKKTDHKFGIFCHHDQVISVCLALVSMHICVKY